MASTILASNTGSGGLISTGDASGVLALQTANGTTAVTIDASQNVGIGTTSPSVKLHVASSVSGYTSSLADSVTNAATLLKTNSSDSTVTSFGGTSTGAATIQRSNGAGTTAYDIALNPFGGNLLVGTTSNPSTATTAQAFRIGPVTTGVQMILSGTETGNYAKISFNNGNGQVGTIQTSGSATSYNTSSDYRLKENIAPMTGALAKVAQLKPVTYTWKVDDSDGEGFIAHELAEVCPHAVTGEKDAVDADGNPKYQGIDTSFLVATLTAAIQEQQALITAQAETINALTARVVALEAK